MNLSPKTLRLGRVILPGLTSEGEVEVCVRCGNQAVVEFGSNLKELYAYCPWHKEILTRAQVATHGFTSWRKSIRIFAAPLDFSLPFAILVSRLKKG